MEIKQYQEEAKRTCASLGDIKLDLCHMALGINTEIVELEEAIELNDLVNVGEEVADAFFYLANIYTFLDEDMVLPMNINLGLNKQGLVNHLYQKTADFQDAIKKHIAYDRELDISELRWIVIGLMNILEKTDIELEHILELNIQKLRARFPDKFSSEKANNRDLDRERQILEQ